MIYKVTKSTLNPYREPHEKVIMGMTLYTPGNLRNVMRTQGGMNRFQARRFTRRLHKKGWANHFPKQFEGDNTMYMIVVSCHTE